MAQPPAAAERVFNAVVDKDGRLIIPSAAVSDLGLRPGEPVEVRGEVRRRPAAAVRADEPEALGKAEANARWMALPPEERQARVEAWLNENYGRFKGELSTDEIMQMTRGED